MSDEVKWVGNPDIAKLLDVSTAACSFCGGPARVPEDVAAVKQVGDALTHMIVCPDCAPEFMSKIDEAMRKLENE